MRVNASLLLVLLACASCGGSSLGGTGGSGGTRGGAGAAGAGGLGGTSSVAGTAGSGGTGGIGGAGGTGTLEGQLPRCLADLVAACTCTFAGGSCGPQTCFAAGVTTTVATPDAGACNYTGDWTETRVLRPDGSLCYSVRSSSRLDYACESGSISWWDASGQMVASGEGYEKFQRVGACSVAVTPTITCAGTGETGVAPAPFPYTDCPTDGCQ